VFYLVARHFERVVLYNNNKIATIEVTVLNAKEILTNQGSLLVVENSVQSCDIDFAMTSNDETNNIFFDDLHDKKLKCMVIF